MQYKMSTAKHTQMEKLCLTLSKMASREEGAEIKLLSTTKKEDEERNPSK